MLKHATRSYTNTLVNNNEKKMRIINFFKRKVTQNTKGSSNLSLWWHSELTKLERKYIIDTIKPMGVESSNHIKSKFNKPENCEINFLNSLSGWFISSKDIPLAKKIIIHSEKYVTNNTDIFDLHFLYGKKLQIYYKDRNNSDSSLQIAIKACNQQIDISDRAAIAFKKEYKSSTLPGHGGYYQLAIILEKNKEFNSVISLCTRAYCQGWGGDWEKRIQRCQLKISKLI